MNTSKTYQTLTVISVIVLVFMLLLSATPTSAFNSPQAKPNVHQGTRHTDQGTTAQQSQHTSPRQAATAHRLQLPGQQKHIGSYGSAGLRYLRGGYPKGGRVTARKLSSQRIIFSVQNAEKPSIYGHFLRLGSRKSD